MDTMSVRYRASTYVAVALFAVAAVAQRSTRLDDHGDDPSTATALNPGETATGEIDPGYDEDNFRLDLPRKATVAVSSTSSGDGQGLAARLLRTGREYETCLAIHNHGRGATRRELSEGTYYLRMSSFGQGRVYEVAVREVAPDDHGGMPETATDLDLGATLSGEIDPAGDTDFFRIELPGRTTLEVSGVGVERFQGPWICEPERRDVDFALADDDTEPGWSRREFEAGIYYLAIRSRGLAGPYEIGVRDVGPDDHGDSPASATPLALGQIATGDIEPRGDLDFYRFELPRRMDVTVFASADAGIDFSLADADGREATDVNGVYHFTEDDGQGGLRLRAVLGAGSHYLRMSAWPHEDGRSRSYEVFVRETPPDDHGNTEAEATAIVLGGAVAGVIDPHDDVDYFRLELDRLATVAVTVTGAAGIGVLTEVDGEVLSEMERLPGRSELELRGELGAGIHYVSLTSHGTTGRYEMVAHEVEPVDYGNLPDAATVVPLGGMAEVGGDRRDRSNGGSRCLSARAVRVQKHVGLFPAFLRIDSGRALKG